MDWHIGVKINGEWTTTDPLRDWDRLYKGFRENWKRVPGPKASVLDVACNSGYNLAFTHATILHGFDARSKWLAQAGILRDHGFLPQRAILWQETVEEYVKRETESYDVILCAGILYHLRDPESVLRVLCGRCRAMYINTTIAPGPVGEWIERPETEGDLMGVDRVVRFPTGIQSVLNCVDFSSYLFHVFDYENGYGPGFRRMICWGWK